MPFSKQDARYEAKPLDLSNYSAVDMMADLGTHRRLLLPLGGRATVLPPPPPDIRKLGPMVAGRVEDSAKIQAAWGLVFDPDLVEGREDGLGTGQMHRTGQNFIPDTERQRFPIHLRCSKSAEGSEIGSSFELGKRPGKAPHPRQVSEPFQAQRRVRERSRARSPDEIGSGRDIMAELIVESKIKMAKHNPIRQAAGIVGHYIAGNPLVAPRAPSRTVSATSFQSSRIAAPNPLVSQWGGGTKLATASANYNYAKDLDAKQSGKTPTDPTLQHRALNKVNKAAPKGPYSLSTHVPHRLVPKIAPRISSATKTAPLPVLGTSKTTLSPHQVLFPDTTQFFSPIGGCDWTGDKPFGAEAGQKLADITKNIDNSQMAKSDTTKPAKSITIPNALPTPALEQERPNLENFSVDLPITDDQAGALVDTTQPRESLDEVFVMESIENSCTSSEFDQPPASDSSIFSTARSVHGQESLHLSERSERMEEDNVSESFSNFQTIDEAFQELKTEFLSHKISLAARLDEIRRIQEDMLSRFEVVEESMVEFGERCSAFRAKRVAMEALEEVEEFGEKEQADAKMEAELKAMIHEHEALMKEHEESEVGGVTMADIEEEEEPIEEESFVETMAGVEEETSIKEEPSTGTMPDTKEEENPVRGGCFPGTMPDKEGQDTPIGGRSPAGGKVDTEEGRELMETESSVENECVKKERSEEKSRLEIESIQEHTRKPNMVHIKSDRCKSEVVGTEGVCLQKTFVTAREKGEDRLAVELLKREQEGCCLQEAIDKTEFDLKFIKVEKDFGRECTEADRTAALSVEQGRTHHTIKGTDDRPCTNKIEKEPSENTRARGPDTQSQKDHPENVCVEKSHLESERHGNFRIVADNHRTRVERARREEEELVREHLERVRHQEECFKTERQHVGEEGIQTEYGEKPRPEVARPEGESQSVVRERDEVVGSERRSGGIRIEKRVVGDKLPAVGQPATGPVRQVVFEQRRPSVAPEPTTRPASPTLSDITTVEQSPFPYYTLELDLQPMYGPHALRVKIGQFSRPQDAILKRCNEVLSSAHHRELSEMPDFQRFLAECERRHSHMMLRAYGSSGRD